MKIKKETIEDLIADGANARTHNERNLKAIAASLQRFGQQKPIVVDAAGVVRAGNGTLQAAISLGWKEIATVRTTLENAEAVAYAIADNRTAELAEWDTEVLAQSLDILDADLLTATGYSDAELAEILKTLEPESTEEPPEAKPDKAEELQEKWKVKRGDLWTIGGHRLLCGDSTSEEDVARLMDGEKASLIHADPPYGMGKEKDGVLNDNLYGEKLDTFQMAWWSTFRPHIEDNGSAYIWGNAEGLWRLWYVGGLRDSERLTLRNEITWDKREDNPTMLVSGVPLASRRMYHPTERCLFFMMGEQGFNNNSDNYWEGWESIRAELAASCEAMGWGAKDIERICGVGMYGHWFTKSQWTFIPEEHYNALRDAARGGDAFKRDHDDLKRDHDAFKREHDELKRDFYETRAFFDNTHDSMTDVWEFPRVQGEERHGHATPKPVEMVARAINSSAPDGAVVIAPFGGTGPEFVAAEQLKRKCYGIELEPKYCAVILERMEEMGLKPEREDG